MKSSIPSITVTTTEKTISDFMKRPPYRIDFSKSSLGKLIANSKRQLIWKFGFANPVAIADGKIGSDCCHESDEHEVIVTYSLTSGKRQIIMDHDEVYYTQGRSIQEGKFEYSWMTRTGHVMKMAAYFTDQRHVHKYDLLVDGMSFFTFPQVSELGTQRAIQLITAQLALQALNENGSDPQNQQQQRPHDVVEPVYDDSDYTYRKKNKVLLTEASARRKMPEQDDSNPDDASTPEETSQEMVPYHTATAAAAPVMDLLVFDTPTSTTCTDADLFDCTTPMGGAAPDALVTSHPLGGVAANTFGNPFYGNHVSTPTYPLQRNYHDNNNNQWNNNYYGSNNYNNHNSNDSYLNRCTQYNQSNSVYGHSGNDMPYQQQQHQPPSPPPSPPNVTPSSSSSPTSCMTTSFVSGTEKAVNTKEVKDITNILSMIVNLDDMLKGSGTTNNNNNDNNNNNPTKSIPYPSLGGQFGNEATFNYVKAATTSLASQATNEVMKSYYHQDIVSSSPQPPQQRPCLTSLPQAATLYYVYNRDSPVL